MGHCVLENEQRTLSRLLDWEKLLSFRSSFLGVPMPTQTQFWTIVASIAAIIGAAAAVWPLLQQREEYAAHLVFPHYVREAPYYVVIEPLAGPIVLTGQYYIKYVPQSWPPPTLRDRNAVGYWDYDQSSKQATWRGIAGIRVDTTKSLYINDLALRDWTDRVIKHCEQGMFEIGIEYKAKGGAAWVSTMMPLCGT